ncbi:uncharacterized protein G2W53_001246 [Senna tora]|uniref:Uncharacterized protein n=1 Tax=Senna tora TaxID=362788 RepID=A0A834XI82_9FABA|nr:uncharacterized protein G2W53_001246 [Senna tora]
MGSTRGEPWTLPLQGPGFEPFCAFRTTCRPG